MDTIIKLTIYIRANSAESGPPLGTTLGNIGVNTSKFCNEFNTFITENKSFTFTVDLPSIGFLIYLLKKEEILKTKDGIISTIFYIYLEDLLKIAKFKFPTWSIEKSSKIIKGTLLSANINIKL